MWRSIHGRSSPRPTLLVSVALIALTLATAGLVAGEGSGTVYRGANPARFRSHMEWRTTTYGGGDSPDFILLRRTLLYLFVQQGETILLGSSGVGVGGALDNGDIQVLNPGQVSGTIGQESIPALAGAANPPQQGAFANGFSCVAQRAAIGDGRGRIASSAQELAGPLPATDGYSPCVYVAPVTGIYNLVFTGPSGDASNDEPRGISGLVVPPPEDFGPIQLTSVTSWDATVRDAAGNDLRGRLFAYYYAGNTGGGGRRITGESYVVTDSGFRYRVLFDGDPFGFIFYSNQLGFQNSDGAPLYRDLMADPTAGTQVQNELRELQGGARMLPPNYPIFISQPDPLVLDVLGIPRQPIAPAIDGLAFRGSAGDNSAGVAEGGDFSFTTTQPGVYYLVVSRDGVNFDPTEPRNRVLRGVVAAAGPVTVSWDGRDNMGEPFPTGDYLATGAIQGGEVHFPFLDVENNEFGGPTIELDNPPDVNGDGVNDCPRWSGGCFGAFYDDRGYRTADGTLVGTAINGPLCPGDASNPNGFGNPPQPAASDRLLGFDTRTDQRGFGFPFDANPAAICLPDSGFGDKKGLDLWTYYPSNVQQTPLRIVDPTAVTLRSLTASREGGRVIVRWETGVELDTLGFHILRSATGKLEDAARVTTSLIPARGTTAEGAAYSWAVESAGEPEGDEVYWLEELEVGGGSYRYGPVRPGAATADGDYRVSLPSITR
ncbi:MAG: hypothetical protein HGA45_03180 [Chloroflexales bacterium]|nr:hypothetical protein [Chloroflexales bacterium]